jgi:hypothetical protein
MLKLFLLGISSSGSRAASVSIICPTHTPTPSIAVSIQLKGEIASRNKVPYKAINTQIPHPLHLTITITHTRTVTISLRLPHTSNISDRKNIIGPTTLYNGKKLALTMSINDPWAAELRASPHSPFSLRPV